MVPGGDTAVCWVTLGQSWHLPGLSCCEKGGGRGDKQVTESHESPAGRALGACSLPDVQSRLAIGRLVIGAAQSRGDDWRRDGRARSEGERKGEGDMCFAFCREPGAAWKPLPEIPSPTPLLGEPSQKVLI